MSSNTILISIAEQSLSCVAQSGQILHRYAISTAEKGTGCAKGSWCTPTGRHIVRAKIGHHAPLNAVFVARRWHGEILTAELLAAQPQRDWILTRILWLSGSEIGHNRLGAVDTMQRYIYIHGTPDAYPLGIPRSHGCVRMRNTDIVCLFDAVHAGTVVNIT